MISQALTTLKKAQTLVSDNVELSYNLALVYDALGRFDDSIKTLKQLLTATLPPDGFIAHYITGVIYPSSWVGAVQSIAFAVVGLSWLLYLRHGRRLIANRQREPLTPLQDHARDPVAEPGAAHHRLDLPRRLCPRYEVVLGIARSVG